MVYGKMLRRQCYRVMRCSERSERASRPSGARRPVEAR
jgi:hypothetical protein